MSGPSGSGKTSAIATAVKAGLETFVVVTEPDGVGSLLDACTRLKAPIDKLHWRECLPHSEGWDELKEMIRSVSSMDQKMLADQRDMGKASFRPAAMRFLESFENFECDRTGQKYGNATLWRDDCLLAVDSFTGMCQIAWGCTVGYKPTANPGEWGIAQNFALNLLRKIMSDRSCYFAMTSHVEKEIDEMTGIKKVMVSAIGAKLAPKIPILFSEVVLTSKRPDGTFNWATLDTGMDLKNRALPNSAKIDPDFAPIVAAHERRKQSAANAGSATTPATPPAGAPPVQQPRIMPVAPLGPATVGGLTR